MALEVRGATQKWVSNIRFKSFGISLFLHTLILLGFLLVALLYKKPNKDNIIKISIVSSIPGSTQPNGIVKKKTQINKAGISTDKVEIQNLSNITSKDDVQVDTASELRFQVEYPKLSRLLKEEGDVVFAINYESKKINFVRLQSSGYSRLDLAAEDALNKYFPLNSSYLYEKNIKKIRFTFKLKS